MFAACSEVHTLMRDKNPFYFGVLVYIQEFLISDLNKANLHFSSETSDKIGLIVGLVIAAFVVSLLVCVFAFIFIK